MTTTRLETRFVDQVPATVEEGVLYVALAFNTTLHLCACGCGNETWLPIRPGRHLFTYDGEDVTIGGSIGNWSFPCRSHYWITESQIVWDIPASILAPASKQPPWRRVLAAISGLVHR